MSMRKETALERLLRKTGSRGREERDLADAWPETEPNSVDTYWLGIHRGKAQAYEDIAARIRRMIAKEEKP